MSGHTYRISNITLMMLLCLSFIQHFNFTFFVHLAHWYGVVSSIEIAQKLNERKLMDDLVFIRMLTLAKAQKSSHTQSIMTHESYE